MEQILKDLLPVIISAIVLAILRYFTSPGKLIGAKIRGMIDDIDSSPVKALIWTMVRFVEAKYPELPGEKQLEKVMKEVGIKYPGIPTSQIIDWIEEQYKVMKAELLTNAPGK